MSTPNRLKIKEMIEAGDCTKEKIIEELGIKATSLATNFTYLRLMGFCPVEDSDTKILSFVTAEEWETIKAERAANAQTKSTAKSPTERDQVFKKRIARLTDAAAKANDKLEDDESEIASLKAERADLDVKIAQIEYDAFLEVYADKIEEVEVDDTAEVTETDDELV